MSVTSGSSSRVLCDIYHRCQGALATRHSSLHSICGNENPRVSACVSTEKMRDFPSCFPALVGPRLQLLAQDEGPTSVLFRRQHSRRLESLPSCRKEKVKYHQFIFLFYTIVTFQPSANWRGCAPRKANAPSLTLFYFISFSYASSVYLLLLFSL